MSKRGANHPIPGHFKIQGGAVEDRDKTRMSKQALVREAARLAQRAGRKAAPARAAKRPRPKAAPKAKLPPASSVLASAHDREFARMNERRRWRQVAPPQRAVEPRYLGEAARGLVQRLVRLALAPFVLARAVVDHFRGRD